MKVAALLINFIIALLLGSAVAHAAPQISSLTGVVIDFDTGEVLFGKNADAPFVPASITKIMLAYIVYEEIEKGSLNPDTMIYISGNAARASADRNLQGQHVPLTAGTSHSVDTMLHLVMLPSSNGACVALAEYIEGSEGAFVARMNETAAALGIFTEFVSVHGATSSRYNLTTAYAMAALTRQFIIRFPDILRITSTVRMTFEGNTWQNTNRFVRPQHEFFFGSVDGFKTGTTLEAGFCLVSTAARDGRRVIAVTMAATTNAARYNDSRALLDFGLNEVLARYEARYAERYADRINIYLHGERLDFSINPELIDGRAMVPFREALVLLAAVDERWLTDMSGAEMLYSAAYMVSVQVIADVLNKTLAWDAETRTVTIE